MLFNKGMILAASYAYHRNDLANTANVSVSIYTGGDLSGVEETYINSAAVVNATTGLLSHSLVRTELLKNRTELLQVQYAAFTQKKIGRMENERVWLFSQRTEELTGLANGVPGLIVVNLHGGAAAYTAGNLCRTIFAATVGLPASGAEFILDSSIVTGNKYKLNDFKFFIQNLLGE